MSMKNYSETIGNRTRGLPGCSAVPQPQRYCVSPKMLSNIYIYTELEFYFWITKATNTQSEYAIIIALKV
jgi:hypothetical protein